MCEYSNDVSDIITKKVICKITNKPCLYWRYCISLKKPVMNNLYYKKGCSIKKEKEEKDGYRNKK